MDSRTIINGIKIPSIGYGPDSVPRLKNLDHNNSLSYKFVNKLYSKFISTPHYVNTIANAFKMGYSLLDFSASYGSGSLIAKAIKKSNVNRTSLIITSRVTNTAQFNSCCEDQVKEQLKGMEIDYLDILMFHWPVTNIFENTWLKILDMKNKGICKIAGVANCNIHHLEKLYAKSGIYPEINQVEIHPLFTQKELRDFCKEKGIVLEAYSPTARQDDRLYNPRILREMSKKYNKSITQLILKWHIQNGIIPIIRSMNINHLKSNLDVFDFTITDEDMSLIDGLNINSRIRYDPDNCDFKSL